MEHIQMVQMSVTKKINEDKEYCFCENCSSKIKVFDTKEIDTANDILKSFIDLGYDYIYKYKFGIALSHSYDYGLYISEPHNFRTQILETRGIFNSLETECLYEIKKLLNCKQKDV